MVAVVILDKAVNAQKLERLFERIGVHILFIHSFNSSISISLYFILCVYIYLLLWFLSQTYLKAYIERQDEVNAQLLQQIADLQQQVTQLRQANGFI